MRDGRIHQIGTPEQVYTRPADEFVAAFVGGANLVAGTADGNEVTCALGTFRPLNTPPAGPVTLIVRPESLRLRHDPGGGTVVVDATYYGHDQLVEVRLNELCVLKARLMTSDVFEPGDPVVVTLVAEEVLAYPAQ
jgi:iron(III) transport system ATP-binding protein